MPLDFTSDFLLHGNRISVENCTERPASINFNISLYDLYTLLVSLHKLKYSK